MILAVMLISFENLQLFQLLDICVLAGAIRNKND